MSLSLVEHALAGLRAPSSARVLPYLCALLAAGLLPFKTRRAYLGVSLALALLWAWLALAAWGSSPWWWAALAFLESLVFGSLAIWGKLDFGARDGPWAVAGAVVVVYALLVFPFLGRFLGLEPFGYSAFGAPLPAVLFSCGILFFAAGPSAALLAAFAVPLGWALWGGPRVPSDLSGFVESTGLQAALLSGVLFLLQPPELRRGTDRLSPGVAYRFANKYRAAFNNGLWVLVLATVLLFFLAPRVGPPRITIHLALLSALGIVVWLAYSAWQSLWYRAVAWWTARAMGRVWVWLGEAWRGVILLLAIAALWAVLPFPKDGSERPAEKGPSATTSGAATVTSVGTLLLSAVNPKIGEPAGGTPTTSAGATTASVAGARPASSPGGSARPAMPRTPSAPMPSARPPAASTPNTERGFWSSAHPRRRAVQLFAAVVLLWLAYLAYRGRTRLVIEPFTGFTGDEKLDQWVAGLGPRLQSELARISDVYKVIDEAIPSQRSSVVEVKPGVQDVGAILKDASAINLGPLKIPANLLVRLVGQIVSGPRITGALHKVDDDFILTAELGGGGLSGNWRIDASSLHDRRLRPEATIQELVVELAYRVATDLVPIGSPRWRANSAFTEGLRHYRETQRQQGDSSSRLREAERCFIRALKDDQQFRQCYFNLGVVYRKLEEHKSAQSAFRRALKEDPDDFEACYALAEALATDKQYRGALWFCEAAIGINPGDARAWDLEGNARRYYEQQLRGLELTLPHRDAAWKEVRAVSEIAVALAWRSLCRRALGGPSPALKSARVTALTCTRNLAVVLARESRFPHSLQLFRQAGWLAPRDSTLRLYEGRTLFWSRPEGAAKALQGTFADGLEPEDQALLWSVLAQAHARSAARAERRSLVLAHRRFLDVIAGAKAEDLPKLADLSLEEPPERAFEQDRP
jgi:tetratricopeptide (TPR) repeat protein